LTQHLEKKNVCEALLNDIDVETLLEEVKPSVKSKLFKCPDCKKGFSHPSGLSRHKKTCTKHDDNVNSAINELKEKLASVQQELDTLRSQQTHGIQTTHVTGDQNITINNCNTYVMMLNNFGSEDVSHVIEDKAFLDKCLKTLPTGIPDVVKKIYYSPDKPENKTVMLKSTRRNTAVVHNDGLWEEKHLNQVVPTMIQKGSKILSNHLIDKGVFSEDTDSDERETLNAKYGYISSVVIQKRPEYDVVSSAVKANIYNHRAD